MRQSATRAVAKKPKPPRKKIKPASTSKAKRASPKKAHRTASIKAKQITSKKAKRTSQKQVTQTSPKKTRDTSLRKMQAQIEALESENAALKIQVREGQEQQTATAEVLGVINASPGDLVPVFEAMLQKALRLCEAEIGVLWTYDGELMHPTAIRSPSPEYAKFLRESGPRQPTEPQRPLLRGESFVQVADLTKTQAYQDGDPLARAFVDLGGFRTVLNVALRKENKVLGLFAIYRTEISSFSDKQVALLQNFAAQAVIAMENARLFDELRARTHDLQESLEYQTATSDVLTVISRSTFDLQPVLDAVVETAARLCNAEMGMIATRNEDVYRAASTFAFTPEWTTAVKAISFEPGRGSVIGRVAQARQTVQVDDLVQDEEYAVAEVITVGKMRTAVGVPLLREGDPIGVLYLARQRVEPFNERQVALVRTFDQAVIAMENARLLNALRERTSDLQESLEHQTATSDVLKVISRSDSELMIVLETVVETAARLCQAEAANLYLRHEDGLKRMASVGVDAETKASLDTHPLQPDRRTVSGRTVMSGEIVHILDIRDDEEINRTATLAMQATLAAGIRTMLGVPLLREGVSIGSISLGRRVVESFSKKQIELVRTFADQAVIAIENARLLYELRQRTEEVAELNRGLEARVAEQVEELGRVGRLKRFLAPQLAELIVSQGDEKILESHRREIVVVFCDLRGYTAFTETAEPEEVLDFLREYHGALGPLVAQFEGTLDQFSGDGIMVFFNDPVPIPDPAERAVNMAVAMREAAGALIAAWRERGRDLGFGAGIAQGYATLGQIGFSERSGYTAIGTVCNVAARLCGEAKDGQILLSQLVNVALKGSIATEQVGALALKGLTQPVVTYNVPVAASEPTLRVIEGGPQSV